MNQRIEVSGETDDGEPFIATVSRRRDGDQWLESCNPWNLTEAVDQMLADGRLDSMIECQDNLDRIWSGFRVRD